MENLYYFIIYIFNYSFWADLLSIVMLYSVFKFLLVGLVTEMIWPTQLFNRTHSYLNNSLRFRSYNEFILKLFDYSTFFFLFYNLTLNNYINSRSVNRI
jgi:hypothetical protein